MFAVVTVFIMVNWNTLINTSNKLLLLVIWLTFRKESLNYWNYAQYFALLPDIMWIIYKVQKQLSRDLLRKTCSENIQQIYRRTPMLKCDFHFIEITFLHGCSPVNLPHIFRTPFPKNTSRGLVPKMVKIL